MNLVTGHEFALCNTGDHKQEGQFMTHYYWNDWYSGWGWFLWIGVFFLIFSTFGTWGYTYSAHRKLDNEYPYKDAKAILNERYARGEITHEEYIKMKANIFDEDLGAARGGLEDKRKRDRRQASTSTFAKTIEK
jgi:putative membrane protein